ncbi:MAG TPA: NADP-dependent oxidoreductase [Bryobacteraceae bacterium]|nr:NADP-dependent oxidoreductase [Bryobacteraceae bacterium]
MQTMKAVRIHEYGGPEVLRYEDAPRPEPEAGEVLVRVHAAAINPVDWKIRAGYVRDWMKYSLPMIPGWDFSGVIESIGPEVNGWKTGDEVYGRPDLSRNGAYAEYIAVRAGEIALKPKSLDHVHAAAIPLAGLTAWQALFDAGGLAAGQKVLIHAAAGGVGSFAVQFAKWKGAFVAGTASGRNQQFLKGLGADQPIDYETTRFEDVVHDFDMVLDTMAGDIRERSWRVLKKGGILVTILGQPPVEEGAKHGVRVAGFLVKPNPAELAEIAGLADSGKVRPIIEAVFPLEQAAKAHELSATLHARGKIVLRVV